MSDYKEFALREDHVALLRRANVCWETMEWGAPAVDGKRPYGNGDACRDIANILGWVTDWDDVTPNDPQMEARDGRGPV